MRYDLIHNQMRFTNRSTVQDVLKIDKRSVLKITNPGVAHQNGRNVSTN